ncbi:MAG TPA: type II toxin-antitoxin system RelE/ParE family toxin [Clostridia bacterium]|nr:type II toxin-antitoxin system RelE/ParE family toxin [Clostridia bacterium]
MDVLGKVYYPIQFSSKKIFYHPKFEDDLRNLIEKSGFKGKFKPLFKQRLCFLEDRMVQCTQKSDWFEKLRNVDDLFAIRFNKKNKNIRIIFTFTDSPKKQIVVLLCNFEEKDKKDYSKAIDLATKRRAEILRGFIEGEKEGKKDG